MWQLKHLNHTSRIYYLNKAVCTSAASKDKAHVGVLLWVQLRHCFWLSARTIPVTDLCTCQNSPNWKKPILCLWSIFVESLLWSHFVVTPLDKSSKTEALDLRQRRKYSAMRRPAFYFKFYNKKGKYSWCWGRGLFFSLFGEIYVRQGEGDSGLSFIS